MLRWFENTTVTTTCEYAGLEKSEKLKNERLSQEIRLLQQIQNLHRSMHTKDSPGPLFQPLQNTHGSFQPHTDVSAPQTNTETNIYRALKSQQKSPGHKVSLPGPEISGLGLLNRMSHLVSIAGQETLAPKGD